MKHPVVRQVLLYVTHFSDTSYSEVYREQTAILDCKKENIGRQLVW